MDIKEEYNDKLTNKKNDIHTKIKLFSLILHNDKLLYYDNNVFEVIKFFNEFELYNFYYFEHKHDEICTIIKIIYHTYFLTDLYNDNIYDSINEGNAEQLFNYIVYCNNNNIINDRIIKLTQIFINTDKKELLKTIGYHYFNYATIVQSHNAMDNELLFNLMIRDEKIYKYFEMNDDESYLKFGAYTPPYYIYGTKILNSIIDYYKQIIDINTEEIYLANNSIRHNLSFNFNKYILIEKLINN